MHVTTFEKQYQLAVTELERLQVEDLAQTGPSSDAGATRPNLAQTRRGFIRMAGAASVGLAAGYSRSTSANPAVGRILIGLGTSRVRQFVTWTSTKVLDSFLAWGFTKVADHVWGRYAIGDKLSRNVGDILAKFNLGAPSGGFIQEVTARYEGFTAVMLEATEQLIALARTRQNPDQCPQDLPLGSMIVTAPTDPVTRDRLQPGAMVRCYPNTSNTSKYFEIPASVTVSYEGREAGSDWVQVFHPAWETIYLNGSGGYTPKPGPDSVYINAWNLRWFEAHEGRALRYG